MPYGQFDSKQRRALKQVIKGKRVHDLGCGDQLLSGDLVKWGASEVVAIDSHPYGDPGKKVTTLKMSFADYLSTGPEIDIAFICWPPNRVEPALLELARLAKLVVYHGKCTDGTCCGWPGLFEHFLRRDLVAYVPDEYNTLCVYGALVPARRDGQPEERAGLDWEKIRPYYDERGRHAGA